MADITQPTADELAAMAERMRHPTLKDIHDGMMAAAEFVSAKAKNAARQVLDEPKDDGLDHLLYQTPDLTEYPRTFKQMLETLSLMDMGVAGGLDPDAVRGDLRDKVDALYFRLSQWKAEIEALERDWIKPLQARAAALEQRIKRREKYILDAMQANGFEELPGHIYRVQVQPNKPAVVTTIPADEESYMEHSDYMRVDTTFAWDKETIKKAIDSGIKVPFASLKQGKTARFYAKAKAPRRKKK